MNTNAKEEFLDHTKGKIVKCAKIYRECGYDYDKDEYVELLYTLKVGYSQSDYDAFLNELDFNYDSGFGGQELSGLIWYDDGSWSNRGEYDGSEWWQYQSCPPIPESLI